MNEKQRLMIKIAKLYYESGLTQDMIAQRLRLSRPRVSRLMQEAIETGIVKISITQLPGSYAELERQLETRFNLLEAVIVDVPEPVTSENVSKTLGMAASEYFNRVVMENDIIGFTWGTTLATMVENLIPDKKPHCTVLQLVGGLGEAETHATGLVSRTAMAIGANVLLMPAPGVVNSVESANLLRSDRSISQALEKLTQANIAFVGIGIPTRDSLLMRDESIISWREMEGLIEQGAVGDISLRYYDSNGQLIQSELNERVIGISLDDLRNINRIVGVAGGEEKFFAILGAIRGRLINSLVTDTKTAQKLMEISV
ncbi:MAG: sugar-binding transcriptional regulator [Chloroflexota bacterium]